MPQQPFVLEPPWRPLPRVPNLSDPFERELAAAIATPGPGAVPAPDVPFVPGGTAPIILTQPTIPPPRPRVSDIIGRIIHGLALGASPEYRAQTRAQQQQQQLLAERRREQEAARAAQQQELALRQRMLEAEERRAQAQRQMELAALGRQMVLDERQARRFDLELRKAAREASLAAEELELMRAQRERTEAETELMRRYGRRTGAPTPVRDSYQAIEERDPDTGLPTGRLLRFNRITGQLEPIAPGTTDDLVPGKVVVKNGKRYTFLGGNPADPKSWRQEP